MLVAVPEDRFHIFLLSYIYAWEDNPKLSDFTFSL